jgi:hypothetical protein
VHAVKGCVVRKKVVAMYEESRRTAPSKVVHLRNLPDHQVYESDILALAQPFGEVHKIMFIPAGANKSKQALVEMSTLTAAEHFVRYYQQQPALFMYLQQILCAFSEFCLR